LELVVLQPLPVLAFAGEVILSCWAWISLNVLSLLAIEWIQDDIHAEFAMKTLTQ
jgi:hypothetical protein